jgi:DNA-binding IclR family transcriptional regulator
MSPTVERETGTAAIGKAFRLLNTFSVDRPWWTLSELANACGMPVSTTSRLLGALERVGAVRREPASHRYSIGAGVLPWARVAQRELSTHAEARRVLEDLALVTGETAALYLRRGHDRVCIDVAQSPQPVHRVIPLGGVAPLSSGAAGRAIAAYLPEAEQLEIGFPPTRLELLRRTRALGLTCSFHDRLADVWSIAAPIKNHHGEVTSALVVSGPMSRYHDKLFEKIGPEVRMAALICSRRSGAPPEALSEFDAPLDDVPVYDGAAELQAASSVE